MRPAQSATPAAAASQAGVGVEGFGHLFDSHPEPMWVYDLETLAFLAVNDAAVATYGYTRDEFLRLRITDIRPTEEAGRVVADVRQPRPPLQQSGVWRHRRKDGSLLDVEITSHTLTFAGRPAALVRAQDVTERRRAAEALRANEERFRATFEQAAVGMAHVGLDGRWLRVNEKLCAIVGYTRQELLTRTFQDVTHRADLDTDLEHMRRLLAGEVPHYALEKRYIRKDGATVWINLTVALVRTPSGAPDYFISVIEDISARKRLEQRTHAALDALLAMAEASVRPGTDGEAPEAAVSGERLAELTCRVLECRHVAIVAVVPRTEELRPVAVAGFTRDEAARWWRQWDSRPVLGDRLEAAHVARLHADEVLFLDRTQPPFPPQTALGRQAVLLVPLHSGAELSGILSVDHGAREHTYTADEIALVRGAGRLVALVLERERLLQERAEARAHALALRATNRRMEEFLSLAGHELRTPLTSVLGNVQLAAHWVDALGQAMPGGDQATPGGGPVRAGNGQPIQAPPQLARLATLLRRTERQGRLLTRLVGDLLDTAQIQAGALILRLEPCDLAALVRDVVQDQRLHTPQRTIHLDIPDGATAPVRADADRLEQVLINYLSNALKFSAEEQPVTVALRVEGSAARVWVRDRGPGLAEAQQDRVWERFYRVEGVGHRAGSSVGLGLGLYLSRTIVERHGGQVGVESGPGRGAAFWFSLPLTGSGARGEGSGDGGDSEGSGSGNCGDVGLP